MEITRRTVLSGAAGWVSGSRPVLGTPAALGPAQTVEVTYNARGRDRLVHLVNFS